MGVFEKSGSLTTCEMVGLADKLIHELLSLCNVFHFVPGGNRLDKVFTFCILLQVKC